MNRRQAGEQVLNSTNKGNANQNHSKGSPHSSQNGPKRHEITHAGEDVEEMEPLYFVSENPCLNLRNQWEIILKCDHHSVQRAWTVHESCTETKCPVVVMAACVFRSWGTILRERVTCLRNSYLLESKSTSVISISLFFMGGNKFLL